MYNLDRLIRLAISKCRICLLASEQGAGEAPFKHIICTRPNERAYLDLTSPLKASHEGYNYLICIIDGFSRYLTAVPVKNTTSENILDKFATFYCQIHGFPSKLLTDNARNLNSPVIQNFCKGTGIEHQTSSIHHAKGNSLIERVQGSIKTYLHKMTHDQTGWSQRDLQACVFAYNVGIHNSLKESPYFLQYSREPQVPSNLIFDPQGFRPDYLGEN